MKYEHPGTLIKAAMKAAKCTQKRFSYDAALAATQVNEVLSGKRPLTPEFCLQLERQGIGDAEVWLFMYVRHQISLLR